MGLVVPPDLSRRGVPVEWGEQVRFERTRLREVGPGSGLGRFGRGRFGGLGVRLALARSLIASAARFAATPAARPLLFGVDPQWGIRQAHQRGGGQGRANRDRLGLWSGPRHHAHAEQGEQDERTRHPRRRRGIFLIRFDLFASRSTEKRDPLPVHEDPRDRDRQGRNGEDEQDRDVGPPEFRRWHAENPLRYEGE